ncbi:MAG: response regulator transcription factor [Chloroflexi bacterium]|nr:response regulator transcription factor [Chloroflexota bacterium]MCH8816251.1 response regulator transcription factor [Chloroflexota bacterium]
MAVTNEVPLRRSGQQAPMLPGMPEEEREERPPIRAHLALDAEHAWELSAHLQAWAVAPVWPVVPEKIGRDEPVIARLGAPDDPEIPFETLRASGARLIAIVPDDSDEALFSAVAVGAWAAVPESEAHVILAGVVREVSEGRCPILQAAALRTGAASAILSLLRDAWSRAPASSPPSPLSEREVRMLRMVADGVKNREIARRLDLSEQTVKNYLSMVFKKMGTRSRAQAATMALEYGWLRED